jgi:hypothetical protein
MGLRASGKLTKEDYTDVLEPALKEAMDSGEARVVFMLHVRVGHAWRARGL